MSMSMSAFAPPLHPLFTFYSNQAIPGIVMSCCVIAILPILAIVCCKKNRAAGVSGGTKFITGLAVIRLK